jgi:hypothetical protein
MIPKFINKEFVWYPKIANPPDIEELEDRLNRILRPLTFSISYKSKFDVRDHWCYLHIISSNELDLDVLVFNWFDYNNYMGNKVKDLYSAITNNSSISR